jgi:hypothetical protein
MTEFLAGKYLWKFLGIFVENTDRAQIIWENQRQICKNSWQKNRPKGECLVVDATFTLDLYQSEIISAFFLLPLVHGLTHQNTSLRLCRKTRTEKDVAS